MRAGAAVVIAGLLSACAGPVAGGSRFVSGTGPTTDFSVPVGSVIERRYAGVIRQRYDFSCGSAALATLLRYSYDYDVAEDQAFRGMWARGDQDAIRRVGFSLLDMKRWLASRGIAADGYKVALDQIARAGVPGIALIAVKNYKHFVVLKGVRGGEVLLADPSAGLTVMPQAEFLRTWNGIFFVLAGDQPRARRGFNNDLHWAAYARAPIGQRFADPVGLAELSLTAAFYREF